MTETTEPATSAPAPSTPPPPDKKKGALGCMLMIGIVGVFLFVCRSSCTHSDIATEQPVKQQSVEQKVAPKPTPQTAKAPTLDTMLVRNSMWDASVSQVEDYLKETLKDPKSLECIEWSQVKLMEDRYLVRCKYRAKNSLGGYVIENKIFALDRDGKVFRVTDVP